MSLRFASFLIFAVAPVISSPSLDIEAESLSGLQKQNVTNRKFPAYPFWHLSLIVILKGLKLIARECHGIIYDLICWAKCNNTMNKKTKLRMCFTMLQNLQWRFPMFIDVVYNSCIFWIEAFIFQPFISGWIPILWGVWGWKKMMTTELESLFFIHIITHNTLLQ